MYVHLHCSVLLRRHSATPQSLFLQSNSGCPVVSDWMQGVLVDSCHCSCVFHCAVLSSLNALFAAAVIGWLDGQGKTWGINSSIWRVCLPPLSISHTRSGNFSWRTAPFISAVCKAQGCCVGAWMGLKVVLKAVAGSEKFMEKKNVGEMNALGWHCCWESLQRPLSCCKHSVAGEIDKNQVQYKDRSQLGLQATCTLVVAAQIWKFASTFDVVAEINRVWHNVSSLYSVKIWKGDTLLAMSKGSNEYRNLDGNIFVSEIFRCDTSLSLALSLRRRPA